MLKYEVLSEELSARMAEEAENGTYLKFGYDNSKVIRRENIKKDNASIWRPPYVHDIDKIMHCPYFNRYADKTQVYSLFKNDDLTRRNLHVQLVSRISRTIGSALHLNLDLIEAIALGHDIGHPPFAHCGEKYLDELYREHTGRRFFHNVHSVRVLDKIFPYNISLHTLNGIASHNGELELPEYTPVPQNTFAEFDDMIENAYRDKDAALHMMPSTLEGAVVRISDIIAYLGKDRQDAIRTKLVDKDAFPVQEIGSINAEIINNLVVNIIENSYGKPYIRLDDRHFKALRRAKRDNYEKIYDHAEQYSHLDVTVKPMMRDLYEKLLQDVKDGNRQSPIYKYHIEPVSAAYYKRDIPYEETEPNLLVVDFIASMTDNFFIELHRHMFPKANYPVVYRGYFDEENM